MNEERIETAAQAAALFRTALPQGQTEERVLVLPLDARGKVLHEPILVSAGHESGTATIDAGLVFREALKAGAEEIIVAHNHPSGNLAPSEADIAATMELRDLARRLNVNFLDHLIIGTPESTGSADFISLAEMDV